MFEKSLIYPLFTIITMTVALIAVPKKLYKRFLLYGIIFGGLGDVMLVFIKTKLVHLIQYKGMGNFNIFGLFSIWTPVTWAFAFMLFFYFLPVRKAFLIPYLLAFTVLNYSIGIVLRSMGLFEYIGIEKYLAIFTFLIWYSVSAWVYFKSEKIVLK